MARRRTRHCKCGCGQEINGRKNKLFINDTHRKRHARNGGPEAPENAHNGSQAALGSGQVADGDSDGHVRDYVEVYCSSCVRVRSGWLGPLPVRYFCGECVAASLCPCENRPAWHSWVYGGGDRPK
jgi:hypothetical protein